MPPQVYEEVLQIPCSTLEPVALTHQNAAAFPFVPLRATGAFQDKEFRVYVLENEYLRAEICPELGGRLISLFDKRDGSTPIPRPSRLDATLGGVRGVEWRHGLEIDVAGRLNRLGPVDSFPREPEDEDQAAAVFVFDRLGDVSWHACWSLEDGRAEISLEVRAFNRSLVPVDFEIVMPVSESVRTVVEAMPRPLLMPRRTAVALFRIIPAAGFGDQAIWGRGGVAELVDSALRFRPTARRLGAQLRIVGSGQVIEAQADNNPEVELTAELPDIGALDRIEFDEEVLVRHPVDVPNGSQVEDVWRNPRPGTVEVEILALARQVSTDPLGECGPLMADAPGAEHLTVLLRALLASRSGDYRRADQLLEQSLGLNSEDVLVWWLKSVLLARSKPDSTENAEAMNAHFLAPLEPILRVQSFLAQGSGQGREPNPLMRPLAADTDAAVDAVHQLMLAGLFEEAHQVLDELLRHRPSARMHVLAGWLFMRKSRMAFEAAHHAQSAADMAPEPPFPNRAFEFLALRELYAAHPSPGLKAWVDLETYSQN